MKKRFVRDVQRHPRRLIAHDVDVELSVRPPALVAAEHRRPLHAPVVRRVVEVGQVDVALRPDRPAVQKRVDELVRI
jgi:hypothetical protein